MGKYDDPKYDEKVLCVQTQDVTRLWDKRWQRFHPDPACRYINSLLSRGQEWIARRCCEENPDVIQVIPYVILRHCGWIFTYTRKSGDPRLEGMLSIGVGGHVNQSDNDEGNPLGSGFLLKDCAVRELREEVAIPGTFMHDVRSYQWAGVLYEPSDPTDVQGIGRYHLGAVFIVDAPLPDVSVRPNEGMIGGQWMSVPALRRDEQKLEPWSRTLLKVYGYLPKYQGQKSKA